MKKTLLLALALAFSTGSALAAEPIIGKWKRASGTTIEYKNCGAEEYCGTVLDGEYKGKPIGKMSGKDGNYKGSVNKLDEGKTYSGKASVSGNTLSLAGCVMGGLICKTEKLTRQ